MSDRACWRVVELLDPDNQRIRYVQCAHRERPSPWTVIWAHRDRLNSRLANWFKQLDSRGLRPVEMTWLGRMIPLGDTEVVRICRARIEMLQAAGLADLNHLHRPRHDDPRPVVRVLPDGTIRHYPSELQAAQAEGLSHEGVCKALWQGRGWFDAL